MEGNIRDADTPAHGRNGAPADHAAKMEQALQADAASWKTPSCLAEIPIAEPSEMPALDLGPFLSATAAGREQDVVQERKRLAEQLRNIGEKIGFHCVVNHGVPDSVLEEAFAATRSFHALAKEEKLRYEMDREGRSGVGYLGVNNWKLPARPRSNCNECFIVKRELGPRNITLDHMPWPEDVAEAAFSGAEFRKAVLGCSHAFERLALAMLPIYAEALGLPPEYFDSAFASPMYRLRLAHYPPVTSEFGINPHVDTSFFTILAATGPGLVIHSPARDQWVQARNITGGLIVNTGQLLAQITNDRWVATKHYALNSENEDRYSIPFFFNATASAAMPVVPTCCSEEDPPKYPPVSYLESQGVAQGE